MEKFLNRLLESGPYAVLLGLFLVSALMALRATGKWLKPLVENLISAHVELVKTLQKNDDLHVVNDERQTSILEKQGAILSEFQTFSRASMDRYSEQLSEQGAQIAKQGEAIEHLAERLNRGARSEERG